MKQRIVHGMTLDTTTPDEVARIIAAAFDKQREQTYRRMKNAVTLDATGAGTATERAPRMYDWVLERITVTAGPNALIYLYANQISNSDLLEVIGLGGAGLYSDAFSNNIFVEAGSQLYIVFANGGAGVQATYNIQAKLIKSSGAA